MPKPFVLVFIACLFLLPPNSVMAAAGDLDPTYSNDGKVTTSFFDSDVIFDAAVQIDGKTVVVGEVQPSPGHPIIARYKLDGTLDPSFGSNGTVFPLNLTFTPYAVVINPMAGSLWVDGY